MPSSTSSFRIADELRCRLGDAGRHDRARLREKARRQSLLASCKRAKGGKVEALWEKAAGEVWND